MAENILIEESRSDVREGRLELVKAKEPRIIFYNAYINEDGTQLTFPQARPDSAPVEFHMEVTEPTFTKMATCITMSSLDIYGTPSQSLLDKLQRTEFTSRVTVAGHELSAGFSRF
jgi:hypothetical protein